MRRLRTSATAVAVLLTAVTLIAAMPTVARASGSERDRRPNGRALLVGRWHGRRGDFATIQDAVDVARPGDLFFFGSERVTHTAIATGERTFIHAPQSGKTVQRGELVDAARLRAIRRYLP